MAASTKLRWKKCINELRFVTEECTIVQEMAASAGADFQYHYEDFCRRQNIDLDSLNHSHGQKLQELYKEKHGDGIDENPAFDPDSDCAVVLHRSASKEVNREDDDQAIHNECDYQMTKDDLEMHETFSKVFKKLALILHPDKLQADLSPEDAAEKTELFTKCAKALEDRHYFVLIDLADKFKVAFPRNYRQQIRWMKKETKRIEEEISAHQKTYNYIFADAETDEEKDHVIRQFMTQVFGPQIFNS